MGRALSRATHCQLAYLCLDHLGRPHTLKVNKTINCFPSSLKTPDVKMTYSLPFSAIHEPSTGRRKNDYRRSLLIRAYEYLKSYFEGHRG
jgi:hypothetical protein